MTTSSCLQRIPSRSVASLFENFDIEFNLHGIVYDHLSIGDVIIFMKIVLLHVYLHIMQHQVPYDGDIT